MLKAKIIKVVRAITTLPELRIFRKFSIQPGVLHHKDRYTEFFFDKRTHPAATLSEPAIYLKKHKNNPVFRSGSSLFKIHSYRTLPRRLQATINSPKTLKLLKNRGINEAICHHSAFRKLNSNGGVRVPRIINLRRFKKFGLTYKHQLEIEYIANTQNLADHILQLNPNQNELTLIIRKLKEFYVLMAEKGVIHLDLRAENILVDHEKQLTVIDWEYAFLSSPVDPKSYCNFSFGTLLYMLNSIQSPPVQMLLTLAETIKQVMNEDFDEGLFHHQYAKGLGQQHAYKFITKNFPL